MGLAHASGMHPSLGSFIDLVIIADAKNKVNMHLPSGHKRSPTCVQTCPKALWTQTGGAAIAQPLHKRTLSQIQALKSKYSITHDLQPFFIFKGFATSNLNSPSKTTMSHRRPYQRGLQVQRSVHVQQGRAISWLFQVTCHDVFYKLYSAFVRTILRNLNKLPHFIFQSKAESQRFSRLF